MQGLSIVIDIAVIIADIVLIVALLKHKNNPEQTESIRESLKKIASKNSTLSDECSITSI